MPFQAALEYRCGGLCAAFERLPVRPPRDSVPIRLRRPYPPDMANDLYARPAGLPLRPWGRRKGVYRRADTWRALSETQTGSSASSSKSG